MPKYRPFKFQFIKQKIPPFTFYKVVSQISEANRLRFIKNNVTEASLIKLYKTNFYWDKIKALMPNEAAIRELKSLVLTEEEIKAKSMLKNIKRDIIETEWPDVKYEDKAMYFLGDRVVTIPLSVTQHVELLTQVKKHEVSPTLALAKIRINGYMAYQARKAFFGQVKASFFDKNTTEEYLDKFRDEATFTASFGKSK
jgi:hypothetical protein